MKRGTSEFEIAPEGNLLDTAENVEALRQLWLDRELIEGYYLGPGDPGDFNFGAWHIGCHLVAAGGVMQTMDKLLLWLEISYNASSNLYFASVTVKTKRQVITYPLTSAEGRTLLQETKLLGFVEGNSLGRTSARGVNDSPKVFNLWRRQDFDQPIDSYENGGKVWEHWCTLRDIRPSSQIGTSVLNAYIALTSVLGDLFPPAVARGRRDYGHPDQLAALVKAGFISKKSALWDIRPTRIPSKAEPLFLMADPAKSLEAASLMEWSNPPRYYMFDRQIKQWNPTTSVREYLVDL